MSDSGDQGSGQKPPPPPPPKPSGESVFPKPHMEAVTAGRKPASQKGPSGGAKKGS